MRLTFLSVCAVFISILVLNCSKAGGNEVCSPAVLMCQGNDVFKCEEDGLSYKKFASCQNGQACWNGECMTEPICIPELILCQGNSVYQCNETGTEFALLEECLETQVCKHGICEDVVLDECVAGKTECDSGGGGYRECKYDEEADLYYWGETTSCGNFWCINGKCDCGAEDMAFIPGGVFVMGQNIDGAVPDYSPAHKVYLHPYCIDKYEVSNAQVYACKRGGTCNHLAGTSSATRGNYLGEDAYKNYPVILMAFEEAQEYCRSINKDLPTEAQWEKAARGGCEFGDDPNSCDLNDQRAWPWGDTAPTCTLANFTGCNQGDNGDDTAPVDSNPEGVSIYGIYNMAGNVAEYVLDMYKADFYQFCGQIDENDPFMCENPINLSGASPAVRGGYFGSEASSITTYFRANYGFANFYVGFRCVKMQ